MTFRYPFPLNAPLVDVGEGEVEEEELRLRLLIVEFVLPVDVEEVDELVAVDVNPPPPEDDDFGRYLIPLLGQLEELPMGLEASNVPVCTLPSTLK